MKIELRPPNRGTRAALYRRWLERGSIYYIKAFSSEDVFGVSIQKHTPSVVLTILPGWLKGSAEEHGGVNDNWKPWKATLEKPGFVMLDGPPVFSEPNQFAGRRISSSEINFDVLNTWVEFCATKHPSCSASRAGDPLAIRLIDCETRTIIDASTSGWDYIALSYVWGKSACNESTASTFSRRLPELCHPCIDDAIIAVRHLKSRYLWIDRFCIDQSDVVQRHHQIANMDSIYANAKLTIIAAGKDPECGLPGVGSTPREEQPCVRIGNITLVSSLPNPISDVNKSPWNTRGWTYQEGLLSCRRLIFMQHQVYFQCENMHCCESIDIPLDSLHSETSNKMSGSLSNTRVFPSLFTSSGQEGADFIKRVNEYSTRLLTYESDSLNAISGVLKAFEKAKIPIFNHFGIPLYMGTMELCFSRDWKLTFALGLIWEFDTKAIRREGFPSWSWVGWKDWEHLKSPVWNMRGYDVYAWHNDGLEIGSSTEAVSAIEWFNKTNLTAEALSPTAKFIHIKARTTTLRRLRRDEHGHYRRDWEFHFGCNSEPDDNWRVALLATMSVRTKEWKRDNAYALLLETVGQFYERRGICNITPSYRDWRDDERDGFHVETTIVG